MTAATDPVGVFHVFPRPRSETLFKDLYFGSGSGIGIKKWFKDQALFIPDCFYPYNPLVFATHSVSSTINKKDYIHLQQQ